MKLDKKGLDFIKKWEGLQLAAYKDGGGVWTIGYGHTVDVKPGMLISKHQADIMFLSDVEEYEEWVSECCKDTYVNQDQFNALVSLCFNIGKAAFKKSTLLRRLKSDGPLVAAPQFNRFIYDNGTRVKGLENRRTAEKLMFIS